MSSTTAWTVLVFACVTAGAASVPIGYISSSVVASLIVAVALSAGVVVLLSKRVPNMLDKRFLFIPGAAVACGIGMVAGYLVLGMMVK